MNPAWGHVVGIITLLVMTVFVGIWIWAWRPRHAKEFDAMARIPMQDDDEPSAGGEGGGP
jgi:cytochrome c oxidase cbb3-type subunit 4